jgi:hypothetical protein
MAMKQSNYFEELNSIDVSEHIEKKGKFSYLSWPFAVEQLGKLHPNASWNVEMFEEDGKKVPFMSTECGYFVQVTVYVPTDDGTAVAKTQIHPVLDNRNKPIDTPTAYDINTSIMRCLVKCIALHGLGLYIYAGEDLPLTLPEPDEAIVERLDIAAADGKETFLAAWKEVKPAQRKLMTKDMMDGWKRVSESVHTGETDA